MQENNDVLVQNNRNMFEKIAFGILFLVAFLTPIFFLPVAFISTQFATSLLFGFGVIVATIVYVIAGLVSGKIDIPQRGKYMLGALAIVPLMYVLAGISNGFSRMTFLGYTFDISTVGFILLSFIFLFLVSMLFRSKKRMISSYIAFIIGAILLVVFISVRLMMGVKVLSFGIFTDLTTTPIGAWNNLGIFFGITTLLSLISFEMIPASKLTKTLLAIALLGSLFFLALINFSTIWIVVAVCSLLFVVYRVFSQPSDVFAPLDWKVRLRRIPVYSVIVCIIAVVFTLWGSTIGVFLANKLSISNVDVRPSLSVTLDIARNTIQSRPLFGSGPNTFVTQWLSYKPNDITQGVFWNTDFAYGIGLIPTFAVTTGLFGVLSWLLFFAFFIFLGVKSIFAHIDDVILKYFVTSSFFVSLYLWIMTWVYVPSGVIFILTFFFTGLFFASVFVSDIMQTTEHTFTINPRSGFFTSLVLMAILVAVGGLGYGLFKNSKSLWYFQKSSYALSVSGDLNSAEQLMARAIATVPYDTYYRALSEIELIRLGQVVNQDATKIKEEDLQKQFIEVFTAAVNAGIGARNADPVNYLNWIALGKIYESVIPLKVQQSYESAQFAYNEALRRNPKNPGIYVLFARLEIARGDLKSARNYVSQAIQAKQNYTDAYFLLSQIEVADKNVKGAIDSVTTATVIDPTNANTFFQLGLLKYNAQDITGAITALEQSLKIAPDYANAKYFLGLSYESLGQHDKAIALFEDLAKTNPDSKEVATILESLKVGKPVFTSQQDTKPENRATLPVKEKTQ